MSGHKWGTFVWEAIQPVPSLGPWLILVLGCLLGIVAVIALRSAKKTALVVSGLILLIPLGALADFPHPSFPDGPIAHGNQVSDDLKALVPSVAKVTAGTSLSSFPSAGTTQFFSTSTVTAPTFSALQCVVTAQTVFRCGNPGRNVLWQIAMRIGTAVTLEPGSIGLPGNPVSQAVIWSPDVFYTATSVEKFTIPAGQTATFGAKYTNVGADISSPSFTVKAVYNCTITPPPASW
jgi:hypothetical protein